MTLLKTTVFLAITAWFITVLLWPKASNSIPTAEEKYSSPTKEGLYKASLTDANFGLSGVQFFETNNGIKHWNINSKFAELHRKENYAYLQEVEANFFSESTGNKVVTVSDYGRSWNERNYIELEGNVSIQSQKGYRFNMDRLNYDGAKHEFTSDDTVHMKGPNVERPEMFLKGVGLMADVDHEHFYLKKNVTALKKMKKNEWLNVKSRSGEFFTNDSRAIFIQEVVAKMPDTTIKSDIFEINIVKEKEQLEARGNVTLISKDRVGHAENTYLEVGGNEIILEGKAEVISKDNRIKGRKIKLYTDDDRIEVEEAEGRSKQ